MADDTDIARARTDEELVASDEDAASAAARSLMKALCVSGPGIVDTFDPATQTAKVRVAIKRNFASLGWVETVCVDVPVQFPGGGGLVITFPVSKGDEGILIFGDRAIDNWFASGGVQEASEIRFHDPSDAMFVPGISSKPNAIANFNMERAEIRSRSGGTTEAAVLGEQLLTALGHLTVPTGMGPSGTPINIQEFIDTIKSKSFFVGP